jgi:hypothetical protein
MNDLTMLERRYRWLLRWYPPAFRNDNADEVLGVLMTGAPAGKRWPSPAETADVLWSALRMRLRLPPAGSQTPGWSGAWAAFSVLAPVFLLLANLLVVEVPPYFLPVRSSAEWFTINVLPRYNWFADAWGPGPFYVLLIFQAVIVIAVLAGWRWVALAATVGSALSWGATLVTYPAPTTLLTGAVYLLETAALLTSPGPRLGRTLLTARHGAVLLLALAAVKLASLTWWATIVPASQLIGNPKPLADILLLAAAALALAAVLGLGIRHHGGHLRVLMAALLYPYAIEFASLVFGRGSYHDLLHLDVTPLHLAILFLLPLVMAALAVLIAVRGRLASSPDAGLTSAN